MQFFLRSGTLEARRPADSPEDSETGGVGELEVVRRKIQFGIDSDEMGVSDASRTTLPQTVPFSERISENEENWGKAGRGAQTQTRSRVGSQPEDFNDFKR